MGAFPPVFIAFGTVGRNLILVISSISLSLSLLSSLALVYSLPTAVGCCCLVIVGALVIHIEARTTGWCDWLLVGAVDCLVADWLLVRLVAVDLAAACW